MNERARRLVHTIKRLEELRKEEETLRAQLLSELKDNEVVPVGRKYAVAKMVIHKTITDPNILMQNGFDINRVTVLTKRIDPTLVKTIGKAEGKLYYTPQSVIVVNKKEERA